MTKSEVRAVALSKLELGENSRLWDIGAGTGSVSVEALFRCPGRTAWAFEKNDEAVELIRKNRDKAGLHNLRIVKGEAREQIASLLNRRAGELSDKETEALGATHAFIGGTSGGLKEIVDLLLAVNHKIRVVINVIALETLRDVTDLLSERSIEAEIVQVQVSRAVKAGRYHLMQGQSPVYIISFGGCYKGGPDEDAKDRFGDNRDSRQEVQT